MPTWPRLFFCGVVIATAVARLSGQTTLSGITYTGQNFTDDIIVPDSVSPTFTGGTTFAGANASIGNSALLYWNQAGTLTGKAITMGTYGRIYGGIAGSDLTLGAGTTVTGGVALYSGVTGATITNQGTITQTTNQSYGYLYASTFTNQGTITNNAGTMYFGTSSAGYTATNTASGQVIANGADIYLDGAVVNQGVMEARNAGNLYFRYNNTTANLGNVVIGTGGGRALLNGTLDNTSATLNTITGGTYELYGGTINNGTIAAGALGFTTSGGTLNNVSYTGDLAMAASTSATFTGGTTFTGTNASIGNSALLYWNQAGTLTGKAITMGTYGRIYGGIAGSDLTLGAGTTVTGGVALYSAVAGATITNQGTITQTTNQSYGYLYAPTFTNQGTITNNAGTMYFGTSSAGYTATNTASGQVIANGADIYLDGAVVNQGVMEARNAGNLIFRYNNTTANLGNVVIGTGGGRALLSGTLDNTSATLNTITGGTYELYGGTINNGTIASGALGFTSSGGTLNNVSYTGDLAMAASTSGTFTGGTTFTGTNASIGNSALLYWNQSGTLTGKAITMGTYGRIYGGVAGSDLTLGAGTTVTGGVSLYSAVAGAVITNQGTITQTTNQSYGYLYAPTFANQGTITNTAGTMYFGTSSAGYTATNTASGQVIANGADIYLDGAVVNQGVMEARNAGNLYFRYNNTTANLGNVVIGTGGGRALLNGTLDNTSATLNTITGGSYELYGGTINNGTIATGALGFTSSGGTLNNVSYTGDLAMAASTSATFTGGTTFTGTNASIGNSALLYWNQAGTLTGKAITMGTYGRIYGGIAGSDLTLGAGTTVTGGVSLYSAVAGATITNQGTITQTTNQSYGYLHAPTFNNEGTITNSAGTIYLGSSDAGYVTTNTASGQVIANGANIYVDGTVVNQGLIEARNAGNLYFRYNNTTANLGNVAIGTGGGRALLSGTLDNTSATLNTITGGTYELYGGTINNGTIAAGALGFTNNGGYLNGVTLNGDLTFSASSSYTRFLGGTTFTGTNATFANSAALYWQQVGTLAGKTITMSPSSAIYVTGVNNALTIDSTTTISGDVTLYTDTNAGTAITNQGTITHAGSGYFYGNTVTNSGTINLNSGSFYLGYYAGHNTINTSTGVINQNGGTVYVYSPLANSGALNIVSGTLYTNGYLTNGATGSITGAGTIIGDLTLAGGTLAPGNSIGTLTVTNVDFAVTGASTFSVEMNGTGSDRLTFQNPTSTVDIGAGLLALSISLLAAPTPGVNYTILEIASGGSGYTGFFAGLPNSGDALIANFGGTDYTLNVHYLANSIILQVPEPSTYALMAMGLALFALRLRRRGTGNRV